MKKEHLNYFYRGSVISIPLISFIIGIVLDYRLVLLSILLVINGWLNDVLKWFFGLFPTTLFLRPKLARGCGATNRNKSSAHKIGFPSGHSQTIWFFVTFLFLLGYHHKPKQTLLLSPILILFALIGSLSRTGWNDNYPCHTPIQVLIGSIIGILFALSIFSLKKI